MQVGEQGLQGAALHKLLWRDVEQFAGGRWLVQLSEDSRNLCSGLLRVDE